MARPTSIISLSQSPPCGVASVLRTTSQLTPALPATACKASRNTPSMSTSSTGNRRQISCAGTVVELRVDQKAKKRAFLDRTLEPLLELPGVGLFGRDFTGRGPGRRGRIAGAWPACRW